MNICGLNLFEGENPTLFSKIPNSLRKLNFFSTIIVKPLKVSLNCWDLIVGKNELRSSPLSSCLDLFKVYGVINVENSK